MWRKPYHPISRLSKLETGGFRTLGGPGPQMAGGARPRWTPVLPGRESTRLYRTLVGMTASLPPVRCFAASSIISAVPQPGSKPKSRLAALRSYS